MWDESAKSGVVCCKTSRFVAARHYQINSVSSGYYTLRPLHTDSGPVNVPEKSAAGGN
jgi:hypothetical protein